MLFSQPGGVRWSTYAEVSPLIMRWHYSGAVPTGRNEFVVYDGPHEPYAAAAFGWGVNPYQESYLSRVLGRTVTRDSCMELKRLARVEPADPALPLTRFLAKAHRLLLREFGVRYVIAFADPGEGHTGGIYNAANYAYAGVTEAERHCIDASGAPVHRRMAYRHSKRHACSIAESRALLGLSVVRTAPKHRWLIDLRSDLRREIPDLPLRATGAPRTTLLLRSHA